MSGDCLFRGLLRGHGGWVTSLSVPQAEDSNTFLSSSRDKSVILWDLTYGQGEYGHARRRMRSHNHFIEDVVASSDGLFALSASWDRTLRLWDLETGESKGHFCGHKKDVLSVSFSQDHRQIVSGSRDRTIKLWNTIGECKATMEGHTDWVSCVRFSPDPSNSIVVSGGWDKVVKVWNLKESRVHADFHGHKGFVSTVAVSPDGHYAASGGKDGDVFAWDLQENKMLTVLEGDAPINALAFATNRYWLAAATDKGFRVWDFDSQQEIFSFDKTTYPDEFFGGERPSNPACLSIAFKATAGKAVILTGWSDNHVRVFECP